MAQGGLIGHRANREMDMIGLFNRVLAIVGTATPVAVAVALVATFTLSRDPRAGLSEDESMDRLLYGIIQCDSAQLHRALQVGRASVNGRDRLGLTPLIVAIVGPRASAQVTISLLIQSGADVDLADANSMTPLMHAVVARNDQAVQLLLSSGADPSVRNHEGLTALDLARTSENLLAAQLLDDEQDQAGGAPG
jgi:hypothetical protein